MKSKTILIIAGLALFIIACKKSAQPLPTQPTSNNPYSSLSKSDILSANFFGKWELTRRTGGNILPQDTTYKAGNGNIFQFNSDSTYAQYIGGTLSTTGVYHIKINDLKIDTSVYNIIYFNNDSSFIAKSIIVLNGNQLTIHPLMGDFATTHYNKLSN